MKRKLFFVLGLIILFRLLNIFVLNDDPLFFLSPRNFNGRGMLVMPSWLDFLIPLLVITALWDRKRWLSPGFAAMARPLLLSALILLTPLLIGGLLHNYIRQTYVTFEFTRTTLLKYLLFVLTFIALNVFADSLKGGRKAWRIVILTIGMAAIAYTQDLFGAGGSMFVILSLINSVGLSAMMLTVGLRRSYQRAPLETVLAAAVAGFFVVFFIFNGLSASFFTLFLPWIGLMSMATALYARWKLRTRIIIALFPFILAVFLNDALPRMVSPRLAAELIERRPQNRLIEEKYGDITVRYPDKKLRGIALKFARLIDHANRITEEEFGVSPRVKELVIEGIGPGGFHAEFPHRIVGRIISEQYIRNCNDSLFLNDPDLSPHFPDPVNGLMHEYSHLFGVIPYHKWWPGPEEEGWATYSATRLARLLYRHAPHAWQPAYDFAARADKITRLNLSGKAVTWSHPDEFGGFILWYHLGEKWGLKKLYRLRWKYSRRDLLHGILYYQSNPEYARRAAEALGKDLFRKYGRHAPRPLGRIYTPDDYLELARTSGMDASKALRMYEVMKNHPIDPSVPLPR